MRRLLPAVLAVSVLVAAGGATAARRSQPVRVLLGRSERGRPIVAFRTGDPQGTPVLVFGCIHGTECAGIAIARALERVHTGLDLWIVPNLNPDGYAIGRRQNGRGVDLNRNWSWDWPGAGGRPWDTYYAGPRPFSERETRIARNLILRLRPRAVVWYHQHLDLVWAWGRAPAPDASTPGPQGCASTTTRTSPARRPAGRTTTFPARPRSSWSFRRQPLARAGAPPCARGAHARLPARLVLDSVVHPDAVAPRRDDDPRMAQAEHRREQRSASFETGTVGDAMSHGVISCPPETPLRVVARMMATYRVHAIFVFEYADAG